MSNLLSLKLPSFSSSSSSFSLPFSLSLPSSPPSLPVVAAALAVTGAVSFSIFRHVTRPRDRLPQFDKSIPRIEGSDNFLGIPSKLSPNKFFFDFKDIVESTGSPCVGHMLGKPAVLVGTVEQAREIYSNPNMKEKNSGNGDGPIEAVFGRDIIVNLPYARWLPLRRNLGQVFHLQHMRGYFEVFVDSARDFVARIDEHNEQRKKYFEEAKAKGLQMQPASMNQPIEVDSCALDFTLDVVTRALFSKNLSYQKTKQNEITDALNVILERFMGLVSNPLFWLIHPFQYWELMSKAKIFHNFCLKWVKERQADTSAERNEKDLLGLMLKAQDPETGAPLTTEEIVSNAMGFYLAGHDTTAHTIAWALYEISRHPEIEEKIFEELNEVLGDRDAPSVEDINKLTYLQCVIKETLRVHPPVGMVSRYASAEAKVGGATIPAGTMIFISFLAIHNNERVWPEPWRFRPERFSSEEAKGRDTYSWMPFSIGERNCIGMNFALNELRVLLAMMCKRYQVRPAVDHLPYVTTNINMAPAEGIYLHFFKRE